MPLIEKQINNALVLITETFIKGGRLPSRNALLRQMSEFTERITGGPTFRPLEANRYKQFDVKSWNKELLNVEFDLKNLFEELVDQAIFLMKRTGWSDTVYRAQRGQLDRILAELQDIFFVKSNAEDHFVGFSETFTDYSKFDQSNSTPGVHNLAEKAALIPSAPMGTKRIKLEDKAKSISQTIKVTQPNRNNVVRSVTAADAPFNHIFHDLSLIWRHDVVTRNDEGCEIEVTFPLDDTMGSYRITRVSITPTSESEMKCRISTSADSTNFVLLPTKSEWISLSKMSKETGLDFEAINVKYLRFILRKESADEVVAGGYRYSFGLKNLSLYEIGRLPQATYQTVVMSPQYGQVEKVALEVQDYIPAGTQIDYYIADETGEFLPISPMDRASSKAPRVIRFGDMTAGWHRYNASGELAYTYNSLNFYQTNTIPITGDYHFGMCQLYRGKNAWSRETATIEELQNTRDSYIQFTKSSQKLHTYKDSVVTGESLIGPDQTARTVLTVPSGDIIYYDRNIGGHLIRPNEGINIDDDACPNYAVAQVLAVRNSGYTITGEVISLSSTVWTNLTHKNVDETHTPQIYWTSLTDPGIPSTGPLVQDYDPGFTMGKWPGEGNYYNGTLRMSLTSPRQGIGPYGENPIPATVSYNLRKDVTHLVRDINVAKGQIWMAHTIDADSFQIRYRIVPENVIRKSIVVTERRGEDQGTLYKEGSDYLINVAQGTIIRPEGSRIESGGACYVDYQWIKEKYALETFSVWCHYDKTEPTTIQFSSPDLDKDNGENFYMDINGGRFDLSEANETPIFTRGWYRFSVESKTITDADAGIRLILALKDLDGVSIFSGTKYFSEIRAFRSPLQQVSEAKLKFGTRKNDRGVFALDPLGYVIVNFNPGSSEDITTLLYDTDSDALVEQDELFELMRVISSGNTSQGVKLRAILRRNSDAAPGTTPKIFGWAIRLSK